MALGTQWTGVNPVLESYYRQVDPGCTGVVGAADGAAFLKKSGLPDATLGQIWDLADADRKGFLNKPGFFAALQLVACAQAGQELGPSSLQISVPPPQFGDLSSPSPTAASLWAVKVEDKLKFDGIFDSLAPVDGLLSGERVRPVLLNSKLPVDVLGRVWDLSDVDRDGYLDREEFAVAMHLVYRSLEQEPVPTSLPLSLVPPSKRKKTGARLPGSIPVLPPSPTVKAESTSLTPSQDTTQPAPARPSSSFSPKAEGTQAPPPPSLLSWVVPLADRGRYDGIFLQTDSDMDGLVGGQEVKDIFIQSGLSQAVLAQIWTLVDTRNAGTLTREQFSLAMHLIQQKVNLGLDPPEKLSADMIPPSQRGAATSNGPESVSATELTGNKELDDIAHEIAEMQREKVALEQDIRDTEAAIRHKSREMQEMQSELEQESGGLQHLESQKQDSHHRLEEMEQQRARLQGKLDDLRHQCEEESHTISTLQTQIQSQEGEIWGQEAELIRTKAELERLQREETKLEQSVRDGRAQLEVMVRSLRAAQEDLGKARSQLAQIQNDQKEATHSINVYSSLLNDSQSDKLQTESDPPTVVEDPFGTTASVFTTPILPSDPFQSEDPFKTDPFTDPLSIQVFRAPSSQDFFKTATKGDPFTSELFGKNSCLPSTTSYFSSSDSYLSGPFGDSRSEFADFSQMPKPFSPHKPPPARPSPPAVPLQAGSEGLP